MSALNEIREQMIMHKTALKRMLFIYFCLQYYFALPTLYFSDPYSTTVESTEGQLLAAHIAKDGQWRFSETEQVPTKLKICLVEFEDRNFYSHRGISVTGIARAIKQNATNGKVVSGGSTITMQVIRLMRKNPPRTYWEKVQEMILATRLEFQCSKQEILALYASHAPFGNNVVGVDAAAWRYFGRSAKQLSWAESATLAVLPNAPGLIYPGKNHTALKAKRDRLLKKLYEAGELTKMEYALALNEPIPDAPLRLPEFAPHLLQDLLVNGQEGIRLESTLNATIQKMAIRTLNQHALALQDNQIMNGAVVISEIETGNVLAYVGNTDVQDEEYGGDVNCIHAPRSSGSILKPLLYAEALDAGQLTPQMLLTDLPSKFGSFSPENFTGQFEGAVPANKVLTRSLNIPMVHLLRNYGMAKFHHNLKGMGFSSINKPASHYGLALILGGAEVNLWELNRTYTAMAQKLKYEQLKGIHVNSNKADENIPSIGISRASIYTTFQTLIDVNRPDEYNNWKAFESSQKIAWKTGTSFGFRDGWAVGVSGKYVVSVWVGNADGEGRPGLTGVRAAAPILFSIFRQLDKGSWFTEPNKGFSEMQMCEESGYPAGENCVHVQNQKLPKGCAKVSPCPYHKMIHLNPEGTNRVTSACYEVSEMRHESWFSLPPMMEQFYAANHPEYKSIPPILPACIDALSDQSIGILYPKHRSKLMLPREFSGDTGKTVFEATHRNKEMTLFWHIDNTYLGSTTGIHQLTFQPELGKHTLTVVDENGNTAKEIFEVVK